MTKLYLIRHGETQLNKLGVLLGNTDNELNGYGIAQAVSLAEAFKEIELDVIISSPLKRAYSTASYIAKEKCLKIIESEDLKEINFGVWEGLDYKEIIKSNPKEWEERGENWIDFSPENGETFKSFYGRVSKAIISISELYKGKRIAIITHDGVMKVIISKLLYMGMEGFWNFYFEHGRYSLLEINDNHCTVKRINVM